MSFGIHQVLTETLSLIWANITETSIIKTARLRFETLWRSAIRIGNPTTYLARSDRGCVTLRGFKAQNCAPLLLPFFQRSRTLYVSL